MMVDFQKVQLLEKNGKSAQRSSSSDGGRAPAI